MSYSHYERLTALDSMFLGLEDENISMHVGAVGVFSHGSLANEKGQVDIATLREFTDVALNDVPRFRQKLAKVPFLDHPVWIDDERFNLDYHLRHSALPAPGNERQLKRMVGRLMSQKLDRGKPLWEMSVVDGLEGGRFAVVFKAHHCMVDGIAGMELIATLLRLSPDEVPASDHHWLPRPAPDSITLLRDEITHRTLAPLSRLISTSRLWSRPGETLDQIREGARDIAEVLTANLEPAAATPLNDDLGPHRRFDWLAMDLADIKRIGRHYGATVNDVVLSIVAGSVGRFLRARCCQIAPDTLFRALVPVNTRTDASEHGKPGNHVVNYAAPLPIHDLRASERLAIVHETMARLKSSRMARGTELFEEISDLTFSTAMVELARIASDLRAYNIVVTNVPGPQFPLYMVGARMEEIYPVVPLFSNQTLGIALFSYDGQLCWGFNADWDKVPDLHDLVHMVEAELAELLARLPAETTARSVPKRPRRVGSRRTTRRSA